MRNKKLNSTILFLTQLFIIAPIAKAQSQAPQQQRQTPAVIRKSTGVLQQSAVHRVEPEYPQEAKAQGISGEVVLEVRVDEAGRVISTKPVSGHQLLVDAAMKAMKNWTFTPTQLSGVAVPVIGNVVFHFAADGRVLDRLPDRAGSRELLNLPIKPLSVETAAPVVAEKEAQELYQKIQNAYDIPIRVKNPEGVVLEIVKATVRAVKRDAQNYGASDPSSSYVSDFALQAVLTLRNRTDKKITGVGFKFTNTGAQHIFFAYPHSNGIEAQQEGRVAIDFMTLAGNPADLLAEIVGVGFADGTIGGAFPTPPQATGNAPMPKDMLANGKAQVDSKPKPLNRLRPNYTQQARKNRVSGTVRLKAEVGADGSVKRVHVANALPDGLTEEAIRIIKVLQFQPAMSGGTPVDYWIVLDVEFSLR
jgi:TonB family protein